MTVLQAGFLISREASKIAHLIVHFVNRGHTDFGLFVDESYVTLDFRDYKSDFVIMSENVGTHNNYYFETSMWPRHFHVNNFDSISRHAIKLCAELK